jgi:hypothetical protein
MAPVLVLGGQRLGLGGPITRAAPALDVLKLTPKNRHGEVGDLGAAD